MKYRKVIILAIVAGLITGAAVAILINHGSTNSPADSFKSKADEQSQPTADKNASQLPGPLVSSPKIVIATPKKGAVLADGTEITGTAQSPDGKLYVIVKGSQSGVLTDYTVDIAPSSSANQAFSFEIGLEKKPKSGETLYLELYTRSGGVKTDATDLELVAG